MVYCWPESTCCVVQVDLGKLTDPGSQAASQKAVSAKVRQPLELLQLSHKHVAQASCSQAMPSALGTLCKIALSHLHLNMAIACKPLGCVNNHNAQACRLQAKSCVSHGYRAMRCSIRACCSASLDYADRLVLCRPSVLLHLHKQ